MNRLVGLLFLVMIAFSFVFPQMIIAADTEQEIITAPVSEKDNEIKQLKGFAKAQESVRNLGLQIMVLTLLIGAITMAFNMNLAKKIFIGTFIGIILLSGGWSLIVEFFKNLF